MNWAMKEKGYSQRRACGLVDIDPSVFRYRSTRGDDAAIRARLRELGSGLIDQIQKIMVAAMHIAEKKVCAHRS